MSQINTNTEDHAPKRTLVEYNRKRRLHKEAAEKRKAKLKVSFWSLMKYVNSITLLCIFTIIFALICFPVVTITLIFSLITACAVMFILYLFAIGCEKLDEYLLDKKQKYRPELFK